MDKIQMELFEQLTGLHEIPAGAYNIRANSKKDSRNTTANIDIVTKEDKDGIDIYVKPGTKNESVHIPVVISKTGAEHARHQIAGPETCNRAAYILDNTYWLMADSHRKLGAFDHCIITMFIAESHCAGSTVRRDIGMTQPHADRFIQHFILFTLVRMPE